MIYIEERDTLAETIRDAARRLARMEHDQDDLRRALAWEHELNDLARRIEADLPLKLPGRDE